MSLGENSGNYNGISTMVTPSPQQRAQMQLEDLLKQISTPSDFSSELSAIYGPQQQALEQARQRASQNATQGDVQLAAMYAGLGKTVRGQDAGINKRYQQAAGEANKIYTQGRQEIGSSYDKGQAELQAMMDRLGLQAAGPEVFSKSQEQENMLQGLLSINNQSSKNLLANNNQSSRNYNTAQVGIIGSQGNEARAGLQRQLGDTMFQLDQQGLGIQSQQGQTLLQLQNQDLARKEQLQQSLLQAIQQQSQNAAGSLDPLQSFNLQQKQQDSLGPLGSAYAVSAQLFGPDKASQAVALTTDVLGAAQYDGAGGFLNAVLSENARNAQQNPALALPEDQLRTLAMLVYRNTNSGSSFGSNSSYQDIINGG
jgi:hypothetical protein